MEIKRLNDNQIRCAITEEEIEELGYHIDDIIGNTDVTQKFMKTVLEKVEEQENIDVTLLSPMVRAELLPNHSMAITFGGITEEEKQGVLGRVMDMIEQLSNKMGTAQQNKKAQAEAPVHPLLEQAEKETEEDDFFTEPTPIAFEFQNMDEVIRISKLFFGKEYIPESALYKNQGKYYLVMDFIYFSKKELRPFALSIVEYGNQQHATAPAVAYIKEHGTCIIKKDALVQLMQL